ncbi:carbohydrate kinase family protein [Mangrovihabitans endophyticus]|uniref:Ribokinase n=1 Tax=Mangrovihabitans endophyticus TaxID=1751298 RepID=A0A8J3FNH1_9ACTN|nr:PfkB family carbohydrate kinase [Mangrovihabitans endophyticus]GGK81577.1 ribokinase [Mangrovihabitans endophyticus]
MDIICAGAVTVDTIAVLDRTPGPDERVLAEGFLVAGGGPAATAAVAAARLGASVGFCGVVGDDEDGRLSRELLAAEGVDTRWLEVRPGVTTTRSMILVSRTDGTRTIVTTESAAPARVPTGESRWLHVDQTGFAAARTALRGSGGGARLSVDGGNPVPGLDLSLVDLYAPARSALAAAFPAADVAGSMRAASEAGAGDVVVTAGAEGSFLWLDGAARHMPGVEPPEMVSTMGAGDVFHGALLAALAGGRTLPDAAQWANAAAALSCRAVDGRSGIPDAATTTAYLASRRTAALPLGTARKDDS